MVCPLMVSKRLAARRLGKACAAGLYCCYDTRPESKIPKSVLLVVTEMSRD
jgi:hypothetical protein